MPIKVKLEGSPAPSELQAAYVIVATGLTVRKARPHGDHGVAEGGPAGDAGAAPVDVATEAPDTPGSPLPGTAAPTVSDDAAAQADDLEPAIVPRVDGKRRADVHLVWKTGGLMLSDQPAGSSLHHDRGTDLTRLSWLGVDLTLGQNALGAYGWTSGTFPVRCTPGEGDQLLTGFLCRPGELPPAAVAEDALYLRSSGRSDGLWVRLLRSLFG